MTPRTESVSPTDSSQPSAGRRGRPRREEVRPDPGVPAAVELQRRPAEKLGPIAIPSTDTLHRKYKVGLQFPGRVFGGVPKNPDLVQGWLEARKPTEPALIERKAAGEKITPIAQLAEQVIAQLPATEDEKATESVWTTFKVDKDGNALLEERHIKALLREAVTTTGLARDRRGVKQVVQHGLFIKPQFTPIGKVGGFEERALHVMTAQGPRSALRRMDYVERKEPFFFEVWVVNSSDKKETVTGEDLARLFKVGEEIGLGASRSQSDGKFELVSVECVNVPE